MGHLWGLLRQLLTDPETWCLCVLCTRLAGPTGWCERCSPLLCTPTPVHGARDD